MNCIFFVFIRTAQIKPYPFTNGPDPTPLSGTIVPPTPRHPRYKICSPCSVPYYCHYTIYKTSSQKPSKRNPELSANDAVLPFPQVFPLSISLSPSFRSGILAVRIRFSVRNETLGLLCSSENIGPWFCVRIWTTRFVLDFVKLLLVLCSFGG